MRKMEQRIESLAKQVTEMAKAGSTKTDIEELVRAYLVLLGDKEAAIISAYSFLVGMAYAGEFGQFED